jgi:murein DD-endopeptidase MepM/ murein hydrolase activator NlpD
MWCLRRIPRTSSSFFPSPAAQARRPLPQGESEIRREALSSAAVHWLADEMNRPNAFRIRLIAAVLAIAPCVQVFATTPLRESFDLQVPFLPAPIAVDGTQLLIYELHLTNFTREPLSPVSVEVLDEKDRVLANFSGAALTSRLAQVGGSTGVSIAPGMRGLIYLELALPAGAPPQTLSHRIEYRTTDSGPFVVEGANVSINQAKPLVLGAPLRGGPWAAIHSPDWPRGHRRVLYTIEGKARIPGRFAIDWVKLDESGRTAKGNDDVVGNAYGYGAEVLAVADAVVAATRDDMPESTSVAAHPKHAIGDATGNYIALDLGDGRFAFYEHLKPGSLKVKRSQRVKRGEVIASLGFTGDSTGPHLHFHVANANSPLGAEGVPFVFERFEVLGGYPDIGALGSKPWIPRPADKTSRRDGEMPASNVVVRFE